MSLDEMVSAKVPEIPYKRAIAVDFEGPAVPIRGRALYASEARLCTA
jgi:hypothetical protein